MTEKHGVKRADTFAKMRFAWVLLLLTGLLVLQSGCQEEASSTRGPSSPSEPEKLVAEQAPTKPAEPVEEKAPAVEETVATEAPEVVKSPKMVLDKVLHDFGEIGPGAAGTAEFTIKNEGTAPLKITQVRVCCGVVARGVEANDQLKPGESAVLELDYRAGMQPSPVTRRIYLRSNDPINGVATLTLKAKIARRVECMPTSLKLFLKQENAGAKDITLRSVDDKPFSIKGFRSTANAVTAQFDPEKQATEFVLKPQANMEKLQRNLRGQISIDLTHPECKNIRVLYDVLAEYTVSPPQIMLFNLKPNDPQKRQLWILSNYKENFEVESVASQKGTVKLLEKKKVDNHCLLTIELTAPPVEGDRAVLSDVVEVKIKDGETLSIQCRGFYQ